MLCVLEGINFSGPGGCGLSLSLQPQSRAAKISGDSLSGKKIIPP